MKELGFTARELAEAVNDLIDTETGQRGKCTDRDIRRLVSGQTQWPHLKTRRCLEQILTASALDLGFIPRAGSMLRAESGAAFESQIPLSKEDQMNRRDVLGIVGGVVISIPLPGLPSRGRLGMSDVARLGTPLGELFSIDDRLGGVALASAAVRQGNRVLAAVEKFEASLRVGDAMYALAGKYLAAAGWFAVDAGAIAAAGGYLDHALRLATLAGDHDLQAQVWNYQAMRTRHERNYRETDQITRAGLASPAARNPKIAALFHARKAHSHAYQGDRVLAERSLGRAHDAYDRADLDTPTPAWLAFVDRAQLYALTAITGNTLGQYATAARAAVEDLRLLPNSYVRNRVHGRLHLVDALLGAREPQQAAVEATSALTDAAGLNAALRTGRVAARLQQVRRRLALWPDIPEAQQWISRYDAAIAAQ
jgi:tetratricopeptide (TPR) repeat protein